VEAEYRKYAKFACLNPTAKYGVIQSSAYVSTDNATTVTLISNSNYALTTDAITVPQLSFDVAPFGFPDHFDFTFSPTNLTVGSGTVTARWSSTGRGILFDVSIVFAADTSISGSVSFTAPVPLSVTGTRLPVGLAVYLDSGTATFVGQVTNTSSTALVLAALNAGGTYLSQAALSSTVPFTWTTNDEIRINGGYLW
jgi:hypothetical protein